MASRHRHWGLERPVGFPKASLPWLGVPVPGSKTLLPVPHCIPGVSAAIPSLLQHRPLTPSGLDFKKCCMESHSWTLTPGLLRFFFLSGYGEVDNCKGPEKLQGGCRELRATTANIWYLLFFSEALKGISCAGFLSTSRPPRLPLPLTRGLFSFLLGRTKKGASGSLGSPLSPVPSAQAPCLPRNLSSTSKTDSLLWQDNRKESGDGLPSWFPGDSTRPAVHCCLSRNWSLVADRLPLPLPPFLQQLPQIKFLVGNSTAFVPASVRWHLDSRNRRKISCLL